MAEILSKWGAHFSVDTTQCSLICMGRCTNAESTVAELHITDKQALFITRTDKSAENAAADTMTFVGHSGLCACHRPAKMLKINKDCPNKGRAFLTCAQASQRCNFFEWYDQAANEQKQVEEIDEKSNPDRNTASLSSTIPTQKKAAPAELCHCDLPLKRLEIKKDCINRGRCFLICSQSPRTCNFFPLG